MLHLMRYAILTAETPADLEAVRELFVEYHEWLGAVVCSRRLAEEIASLPGPYAAPEGRLLLAKSGAGDVAGVVGVRPHHADACEMKRLYVRPAARGHGLGRALAEEAIEVARDLGYRRVLLTTLPDTMRGALALYVRLGFRQTDAFMDHSHVSEDVDMFYMVLDLGERGGHHTPGTLRTSPQTEGRT
ncbi:MAG: hypothetical protein Kow0067_13490 [Coriobacteriia bacterium]